LWGQARLASRALIIALSALLLLGAMIFALGRGSQDIPADQVIKALRDRESVRKSVQIIIHEVRLPRALVGALVGMNLAVAGTLLQGVVRSPLADPYILGISAGGGLAAATTSLLITDFPPNAVPISAFVGSLIGALIVYAIAWDGTGVTTTRLALAGVALTAMFGAFTTTIVVMTVTVGAQMVFQWLVGGLYTAGWEDYHLIAPYSVVGFILAMLLASRANILALGDDVAQGLGLHVEWTRFLMSAVAAMLAGSSVAVAGLIGFVGLLVPYVARRLVGSDFRFLIPTSA
jgi:iron complex transport system permease protein